MSLTALSKIRTDNVDANGVGTPSSASIAELLIGLGSFGALISFLNAMGYGAGAGGAVTQASSRTTGVTINKPSGQITLASAAGSATAATFTVTNSFVGANDTVILSVATGTDPRSTFVTGVAAGSFNITTAAISGTTTEQPVINFTVVKGSNN